MSYQMTASLGGGELFAQALLASPQLVRTNLSRAQKATAAIVEGYAKSYAPVHYGILRGSIHTEGPRGSGPELQTSVGTNLSYAPYQEEGTGIYGPTGTKITPKNGKALVFTLGGKKVFARSVKGTPGKWYMQKAADFGQPFYDAALDTALEAIVEGLMNL